MHGRAKLIQKRLATDMTLAELRREYTLAGLRRADLDADPIAQFQKWFAQAMQAEIVEPNAMTLATVSADGHFVATTGGDATVKLWDAVTLRQLHGIKVPPETLWAGIDPTGRWLVMTDDVRLDVAAAGRTPIAPAELAALIRCRVPFRLDGQIIVPATPACP